MHGPQGLSQEVHTLLLPMHFLYSVLPGSPRWPFQVEALAKPDISASTKSGYGAQFLWVYRALIVVKNRLTDVNLFNEPEYVCISEFVGIQRRDVNVLVELDTEKNEMSGDRPYITAVRTSHSKPTALSCTRGTDIVS